MLYMQVIRKYKGILTAAALGVLYLIWLHGTGIAIPCPFRMVTGRLCPGCGITRMFVCLSRLDFEGAFRANPFLFVTLPFLVAQLIYAEYMRGRGRKLPAWDNVVLIGYIIALLVFGVVRNFI